MADNFENLPGIPVQIIDGKTLPTEAPAGPTVAVIGTAGKGPAKLESTVLSGASAITKYGLSGSLGRGLAEVFQGGADNAVGFRVLTTKGELKHVGDVASSDGGYTIVPNAEGSDALELYSVLYDHSADRLRVYEVASGTKVYDRTGEVIAVDLGAVTVTGTADDYVSPELASIGLSVKVADVEADQTFLAAAVGGGVTVCTMTAGLDGLNLGLLQESATNTYRVQIVGAAGDSNETEEWPLVAGSVDVAAGTFSVTGDVHDDFEANGPHHIRFISNVNPIRMDRVLDERIGTTAVLTPLRITPGSDFNGLPMLNNHDNEGHTYDPDLAEVEPGKMNLYEALRDAELALEASPIDVLLPMEVFLDDPALDTQTSGETKLPSLFSEGLLFSSEDGHADEGNGVSDNLTGSVAAGIGNRLLVTFDDGNEAAAGEALLADAGRGASWIVFRAAKGAGMGANRESDEIVRVARILNWENNAADSTYLHLDRDVGFNLDGDDIVAATADVGVFEIFSTSVLFYHRQKEILGVNTHFWYDVKADNDGNVYHEVNFAYRLGKICQDMTANETTVIGCIGVRPPTTHSNPAHIANWIGKSPEIDEDGDVSKNGTGLLGNKFVAGRGLNNLYADVNQFDPGFKDTTAGYLDGSEVVLDDNDFEVDLGKFLSIVATYPVMTNDYDTSGLGYIASGAGVYAGMIAGLAPWRGSTAKRIASPGNIRSTIRLAKRHLNSLTGARYVLFNEVGGALTVVDGPSAALPTSDYTRNMTMRLVGEVIRRVRAAGRPFLGDPLSAIRKAALETALKKEISEIQRVSDGALETFDLGITQSNLDKRVGRAKVTLALGIINELRKLFVDVSLTA